MTSTLPAGVQTARPVLRSKSATPRPASRKLFCSCKSAVPGTFREKQSTPRPVTPRWSADHASWLGCDASNPAYHDLVNQWHLQGLHWIACADGQMPIRPVKGGHTRSGEPLYIARTLNPAMKLCIGTFRPSTGLCYVEWRGRQHRTDHYEVLCYRSKLQARAVLPVSSTPDLSGTLQVLSMKSPLKIGNIMYTRTW
ncbi:uncharacterized protein LOC128226902 [Mya arenaria]|uniref:uncharacterized protein LOC128226902 n=1 Tax=Mya arenaria TaxID=6604 RepID=UPI0022E744CF|nr:uncharacterized protein LOC128226902 [Mya arenaria]